MSKKYKKHCFKRGYQKRVLAMGKEVISALKKEIENTSPLFGIKFTTDQKSATELSVLYRNEEIGSYVVDCTERDIVYNIMYTTGCHRISKFFKSYDHDWYECFGVSFCAIYHEGLHDAYVKSAVIDLKKDIFSNYLQEALDTLIC